MVDNISILIKHLHQSQINNEIIGIALSLVLDKSREDITILGLQMVKSIAKSIGSDLMERYFCREMWEISAENSVGLAKSMIELIAESFTLAKADSLKAKLISIYIKYCENDNWNTRKYCVGSFCKILQKSSKDMQDLLLPVFCKLLKDKSKWVKEQAINNCSLVIIYSQIQIPTAVMKHYFKVSDNGFYTVAYYFSAVLLTLGAQAWGEMKKIFYKILEGEYKNRICLIHSMHEIAKIIGAEVSGKELVVVFDGILEDCEMRIEAYKSLPSFLRELFPEARDKYKTIIKNISRDPDWRYRFAFTNNICEYIGVYDYNHIYTNIWPLALEHCEDKNCTIRFQAAKEVAKLAMYLLSKNIDWKRHIEMSIKKYSNGTLENRLVFLKIIKNLIGTEFAKDFSSEIEYLAKDKVANVRIMCAEAVNYDKEGMWEGSRILLEADKELDVRFKFGKVLGFKNKGHFITPPLIRNAHNEDVGGIVKFDHSLPMRSNKISSFCEVAMIYK